MVIRTELSPSVSIPWLNHCVGTTRVVLRHFVNGPFHQYVILSISLYSICHLLTCHLVKMPSYHFVSLSFSQLTILSTCHFVNLPFCQLAILSACHFVNFVYVYHILSSIMCTFIHWKWCWNIPCALYMEGSWERVLRWLLWWINLQLLLILVKLLLKNKNFAKNHCEIQVRTILVCALYSIKYGTCKLVNVPFGQLAIFWLARDK